MPISEATYLRVIEEDPERKWELRCGELHEKEPMTWAHESIAWRLGFRLQEQLDFAAFEVRVDAGRVRRSEERYYIPDVMVIPKELAQRLFSDPNTVVILPEPLPFIAEVWSPSTGRTDLREKLPSYRQRGDAEVGSSIPRTARCAPGDGSRTGATRRRHCVVASRSLPRFRAYRSTWTNC